MIKALFLFIWIYTYGHRYKDNTNTQYVLMCQTQPHKNLICCPYFMNDENETELPNFSQVISGKAKIQTQTVQIQRPHY